MADHGASTDDLLALASDPDRTPFDYIVVGSGAGGGVLAARLARSGRRVLVGRRADVATDGARLRAGRRRRGVEGQAAPVYEVPVYYAAASRKTRR